MDRQQQKEATAKRIFAAATELFITQGYEATTVAQICKAAGVAKGTFFVHYVSKAAVLDELSHQQMGRIRETIAADTQFAAQPLRVQVHQLFTMLGANLTGYQDLVLIIAVEMITRPGTRPGDQQEIPAFDALLLELVRTAQIRNELRTDVTAERIATALRNVYFAAVFDWVRERDLPFNAIVEPAIDLLFEGITVR